MNNLLLKMDKWEKIMFIWLLCPMCNNIDNSFAAPSEKPVFEDY